MVLEGRTRQHKRNSGVEWKVGMFEWTGPFNFSLRITYFLNRKCSAGAPPSSGNPGKLVTKSMGGGAGKGLELYQIRLQALDKMHQECCEVPLYKAGSDGRESAIVNITNRFCLNSHSSCRSKFPVLSTSSQIFLSPIMATHMFHFEPSTVFLTIQKFPLALIFCKDFSY